MKSLATTKWTSIMKPTLNRWRAVADGIFPEDNFHVIVCIPKIDKGLFFEAEYYRNEFHHPYVGQDIIGTYKGVSHWCYLDDLNEDFNGH